MKSRFAILLILTLISCREVSDENGFEKVELHYVASNENEIKSYNKTIKGDFITLKLLKSYYDKETDSISWSKGVHITFPKKDESFMLCNDSLYKFSLFIHTKKGLSDVKMKSITDGELSGERIDSLTWSLKIKTKEFSLERTLTFDMDSLKSIRLK